MRIIPVMTVTVFGTVLSGCFSATSVITNPDQVVVEAISAKAAAEHAQQQCGEYGKHAHYIRDGGSAYWFPCRKIDPLPVKIAATKTMAKKMEHVEPPTKRVVKKQKRSIKKDNLADRMKNSGRPIQLSKRSKHNSTAKRMKNEVRWAEKGSIWVQVAASKRRNDAAEFAKRVIKRNRDLIGTRSFTVQKAELRHSGTIYRSRVGPFRKHAAAAKVCQKLRARRQDCLVAVR